MHRLATGQRINGGSDDPAGLVASESLRQTLAALDAESSANERASTQAALADGALGQISDMLIEAKSLVDANAIPGGLTSDERAANQLQIDSILSAVDTLSKTTSFAGQKLLDGSATIGASGKSISIDSAATSNIGSTDANGTTYTLADLKTGKALVTTGSNGSTASDVISNAINDVATQRASVGAFDRHTLQTRISSIAVSRENMLSAISMISDTDYAAEFSEQSKLALLQKSAAFALRQSVNRNKPSISTFSIRA